MALWRIDLVSLRLFVAVCEESSIARAAEREFIAPSAVSKRINDLESLVGSALLQRHKWGVRATPAGEALLHHARNVLRSLEKMQGDLSEYTSGVRGHIRIFANVSSIVETLPDELGAFLRRHEGVKVDLEEHTSAQVVRGVADGATDIGICWDAVDTRDVEVFPYRHDQIVTVLHRDHPLACVEQLAFIETLDFDQIGVHPDSAMYTVFRRLAAEQGKTVKFRIHVSTFEAVCRMVRAQLGLAIAPREAVGIYSQVPDGEALRIVPLTDPWAERRLVVCVRRYDALPVASRMLVDHLCARNVTGTAEGTELADDCGSAEGAERT
ncbi:LysR substrate-binding domain-containing protein [Pandoraea commovens]|uniref:LysR substrate-binding domain-containing protein n=1 Tax=Pandoraea commovens TaxID=2508289 RepID=A0ABY5QL36_9BURK|nr:LysR substrate-binding domain-containing protein [Pandoraea commovens]UVA81255.1 LysR substrate-binding domain-containing protein [Pandoraea commovens]